MCCLPGFFQSQVTDDRIHTVLLRSESSIASCLGTQDVAALVPETTRASHMPRVPHLQGSVNRRPSVWADTADLRGTPESPRGGGPIRRLWARQGGGLESIESTRFGKARPLATKEDA